MPDCRTSRSEGATTEGAAADTWNSQLMAAGGSQVPATGNIGHWNAVVDEVLDFGDTSGRSRQACTALAEGCPASAVRREVVLTDHGRTCWCRRLAFSTPCSSSVIVFGAEARTELQ